MVKKLSGRENRESADETMIRLSGRLARQNIYDLLLALFPPLGASVYLLAFAGDIPRNGMAAFFLAVAALLAAALLVRLRKRRAGAPTIHRAARLLDERADGKERFMTLATLPPATEPSIFMARLRQEAGRLGARVDLGRDFPYRVKRSFLISLAVSLLVVLGFHLWSTMDFLSSPQQTGVHELAEELSRVPGPPEWTRTLQTLADRLQDKRTSADEKHQLVAEALKNVEEQSKKGAEEKSGGVGSGQANELLRGIERELGKSQGAEGGDLKTNLPREGEGKETKSGSGTGGGDPQTAGKDASGGARVDRQDRTPETKSAEGGQGGEKKNGMDSDGKQELANNAGKDKGNTGGRNKVGEEIPRGRSPERYLQPGEKSGEGLKDGRFVTVQLPEEEIGSSAGGSESDKRREVRPKVPVGNVPLSRPDVPDALPERQHLPLEYRGMIR